MFPKFVPGQIIYVIFLIEHRGYVRILVNYKLILKETFLVHPAHVINFQRNPPDRVSQVSCSAASREEHIGTQGNY